MKKRTDLTGAFKLDPVYLKHSHQDSGEPLALLSPVIPSELHPWYPGAKVKSHVYRLVLGGRVQSQDELLPEAGC